MVSVWHGLAPLLIRSPYKRSSEWTSSVASRSDRRSSCTRVALRRGTRNAIGEFQPNRAPRLRRSAPRGLQYATATTATTALVTGFRPPRTLQRAVLPARARSCKRGRSQASPVFPRAQHVAFACLSPAQRSVFVRRATLPSGCFKKKKFFFSAFDVCTTPGACSLSSVRGHGDGFLPQYSAVKSYRCARYPSRPCAPSAAPKLTPSRWTRTRRFLLF